MDATCEFIAGIGSAAAYSVAARAQQPTLPVVGFVDMRSAPYEPFVRGLTEAGFIDHRNAIIDHRQTPDADQMPAIAVELVRAKVAVICAATNAIISAKAVTSAIPMVFIGNTGPVAIGLVTSFNHHGGNVTGVRFSAGDIPAKQVEFLHELMPAGTKVGLRVRVATDPDAKMGPVVTAEHKKKIEGHIQLAVDEGAELVIDGRGRSLPGHEEGFFLWPTLIDHTTPAMKSYQDEIFGPVLQIVRAETFEEALSYPSAHHQGNAVSIFTRNGHAAQRFVAQAAVGMAGVNVPMPTPVGYYSHGGWKASAFGDLNQYGDDSIRFFTRTKVVTQRWPHAIGGMDVST